MLQNILYKNIFTTHLLQASACWPRDLIEIFKMFTRLKDINHATFFMLSQSGLCVYKLYFTLDIKEFFSLSSYRYMEFITYL